MRTIFPSTFLLCFITCLTPWACTPSDQSQSQEYQQESVSIPISGSSQEKSKLPHAPAYQQILLVTTENWDTPKGILRKYGWDADQQKWQIAGAALHVLIGKKGLGWGLGLHDAQGWTGPRKKEGDLKSPAGVFELGTAFGYQVEKPAFDWPYTPVVSTTMCIEDIQSMYYNTILDEGEVTSDWESTDHMLRKDDLYEWGVFVLHNSDTPIPGGGSCIFIHVWREGGKGTAGCTSLDKNELKRLLQWMDPQAQTLLIQVPKTHLSYILDQFDDLRSLKEM
ncbi:MAG: L,D-transpeptidase family protein [Bacteroidota bacterium]